MLKATSAIGGPNDDIPIPRGSMKTDWEVELGVVIGKRASYVEEADALDYVAGYCVCNDVSEREFQIERGGTWDKGKGCDSFGPLGPWLVTKDEVADPQALDIWLNVNGERFQDEPDPDHDLGVAHLVSYISRFMTPSAPARISTGTLPGGPRPEAASVPEARRRGAPGHRGPGRAAADLPGLDQSALGERVSGFCPNALSTQDTRARLSGQAISSDPIVL